MTTTPQPTLAAPGAPLVARSVEEVRDHVRAAAAARTPLRIAGAGTWLDAGRPVGAATTLSLSTLAGVLEYVPGDLTLTARAGTTLGEIARATAEHGQWLTLDPFGGDAGTIGATIATASAGPLAHGFGTPRDIVLGLEFVTGAGAVARGGGRVVKNVAGFDLTRLLTGSWGTLGAITEVTVRLRARPEAETTLAVTPHGRGNDETVVDALRQGLARLPFTPFAAELLDGALAGRVLSGATGPLLLLRVGGNAAAVRAHRERAAVLGDVVEVDADVWRALRTAEPAHAAVFRLSHLPSHLASLWHRARDIARAWRGGEALVHGDPGRGVVRVMLPLDDEVATSAAERLRRLVDGARDGTRIAERLPASLWPAVAPSRVADRLSRGIRHAYDPHRLLNPGILGDVE